MIRLDTYEDHLRMIDALALADGAMPTAYLRPMAAHWVYDRGMGCVSRLVDQRFESLVDEMVWKVQDYATSPVLTAAQTARMLGLKEVQCVDSPRSGMVQA